MAAFGCVLPDGHRWVCSEAMFGYHNGHTDTSKVYNSSAENYGYWYVDGSVVIPSPGVSTFRRCYRCLRLSAGGHITT